MKNFISCAVALKRGIKSESEVVFNKILYVDWEKMI